MRVVNFDLTSNTQGIWKCVGVESGTPFTEVDLDEGEWVDYDEKVRVLLIIYSEVWSNITYPQAGLPVGISAIESRWRRA